MAAAYCDIGHGGRDCGALSADGRYEADSNLTLGLLLAPMLLTAGHSVRLSRQSPLDNPTLYERVTDAWAWGADLFISLHIDASSSVEPHGHHAIHSIHDPPGQRGDRLAWLLVNGISEATGRAPRIFTDFKGPVWTKRSLLPPRQDWHGIIRYAWARKITAACIVERGFITNPDDACLLFDDEFLRLQAEGIVAAVNRYTF